MTVLTLDELERRAYITGDTQTADLLARQMEVEEACDCSTETRPLRLALNRTTLELETARTGRDALQVKVQRLRDALEIPDEVVAQLL